MTDVNLHTHTYRNHHAFGTDRQVIEAAIKGGYKEIGFSEHNPLVFRDGTQSSYRIFVNEVPLYMESLRSLREEYKDQIKIHIGFEMEYYHEYFEETVRNLIDYGAEYLILGQHYVYPENEGGSHCFHPMENDEDQLKEYCRKLKLAADSGLFTYIAHTDGFNFPGRDAFYEAQMGDLIEYLTEKKIPLELNRTGFFEHRCYPDERFWHIAAELKAKAVIGLDVHNPKVYKDRETVEKMEKFLDEIGVELIAPQPKLLSNIKK